jgi:hypothetical protein
MSQTVCETSRDDLLVAARPILRSTGLARGDERFGRDHWFIGHDSAENRAPFSRWLTEKVPQNRIVFLHNGLRDTMVLEGRELGSSPCGELKRHPELAKSSRARTHGPVHCGFCHARFATHNSACVPDISKKAWR